MQFGIYAQITDAELIKQKPEEETINKEELKDNFKLIFDNSLHSDEGDNSSIIEIFCKIKETKSGKYDIDVTVPLFNIESSVTEEMNNKIKDIYVAKLVEIAKESQIHTIYTINYVAYVNEDILSLVIKSTLKEGTNPQRLLIQTINYDMKNDKILTLEDVLKIKDLNKENVQNEINAEIKTIAEQKEAISSEGYNVYKRNPDSDMYEIKNTSEFFLGENNILYILYPYGNGNFTSDIDIIII